MLIKSLANVWMSYTLNYNLQLQRWEYVLIVIRGRREVVCTYALVVSVCNIAARHVNLHMYLRPLPGSMYLVISPNPGVLTPLRPRPSASKAIILEQEADVSKQSSSIACLWQGLCPATYRRHVTAWAGTSLWLVRDTSQAFSKSLNLLSVSNRLRGSMFFASLKTKQ